MDMAWEAGRKGQRFAATAVLQEGPDHRRGLRERCQGSSSRIGNGDAERLQGSQDLSWTVEVENGLGGLKKSALPCLPHGLQEVSKPLCGVVRFRFQLLSERGQFV